jgi:hypothetical protein
MAQPSIAFVFVERPPDRAEAYDPIWRYTVPYMRFRHPDVQRRHWVQCVRDALARLSSAGSVFAEVHLYAHANESGSVWGRLASDSEPYRALTPDSVRTFLASLRKPGVKTAGADRKTQVFFHGCNLGKSPDALRLWRDLFAPGAFARAPTLFQHFCAGPLVFTAACPGTNTPLLSRNLFSLAEIDQYVQDVVAEAPARCSQKLRADFPARFRQTVLADLDSYLLDMYEKLNRGGEISWADAAGATKAAIATRMRTLFDQAHGVPLTFLSSRLHGATALGGACSEALLKAQPGVAVYFPWDAAPWRNHHHWEPRPPS